MISGHNQENGSLEARTNASKTPGRPPRRGRLHVALALQDMGFARADREGRLDGAGEQDLDACEKRLRNVVLDVDIDAFAQRVHLMTKTQKLVLALIATGLLNKQIAYLCGISEATVKSHVSELTKRLGNVTRVRAAVLYAVHVDRSRGRLEASGQPPR
jgi:DNA-binding CsgD family transcriptional regulator